MSAHATDGEMRVIARRERATALASTAEVIESNAAYEEGQLPGAKDAPSPADEVPYHLRPGAPQRRVVCAANRILLPQPDQFGHTDHLVTAPRHFHLRMHAAIKACIAAGIGTRGEWMRSEQGFIDQWGTFMGREEAFQVATAAGQILYGPHLGGGQLDSSDLY